MKIDQSKKGMWMDVSFPYANGLHIVSYLPATNFELNLET